MPALLALLIAAVATGPEPAAVVAVEEDQMLDEDGNGLANCVGATQEASIARMNDLPLNLVENGMFAPLNGSAISFTTPAMDTDQIMVTFSAEGRLQGQSGSVVSPVDFVQVQILLDNAPMPPLNDLAFTTDAGQADATQACRRVGEGDHTVRVVWQLVDQDVADVLTGTLDTGPCTWRSTTKGDQRLSSYGGAGRAWRGRVRPCYPVRWPRAGAGSGPS